MNPTYNLLAPSLTKVRKKLISNFMPFWPDNSFYFLTTSTFEHRKYFDTADKKKIILNKIKKAKDLYIFPLYAYSIAMTHLHLLFYLKHGLKQQRIKQIINGGTSFEYNRIFPGLHDKLWGESYTLIVRQSIFWKVWGYVIGNLLKHGEVQDFNELMQSPFSSCGQSVKRYGVEFVKDQIACSIALNLDGPDEASKFTEISKNKL